VNSFLSEKLLHFREKTFLGRTFWDFLIHRRASRKTDEYLVMTTLDNFVSYSIHLSSCHSELGWVYASKHSVYSCNMKMLSVWKMNCAELFWSFFYGEIPFENKTGMLHVKGSTSQKVYTDSTALILAPPPEI
jgi:hypothetical protein